MSVKVVKEKRCKSLLRAYAREKTLKKWGLCRDVNEEGESKLLGGVVESANRSMWEQKARCGYGRGGR